MIAEVGLAALWLAAALALAQLLFACGAIGEDARRVSALRPLSLAMALLCALSFGALILCFARTDLSVLLVAQNSASSKPMLFKIAGAWGNHEGSMLMWVTVLALSGAALALPKAEDHERTRAFALGAQAALALGFFAFLLLSSNPFARLDPSPVEGRGLNPILQDPGLAFHPPTLYLGYVGLSVAFSLAVGALLAREVGPSLARAMRPWVLAAWIFLTIGITAGSYWAYYTLGWGGWWFWDPVENASLMPWLAATALLHSLQVLAARGSLRAWTMVLALIAFSMSMVGTFLVRSGILTSVHAFAVDPARGAFILALLALYVGGAFALFAARIGEVREGAPFDPVSREGGLVVNNLLLSVILGTVMLGTLYPLVAEAITGEKLSVGPPYFNMVAGPLGLALAALLLVGPQLRWRRDRKPLWPRLAPGLFVAAVTLAATLILAPAMGWLARLGLALGAALVPASVQPLFGRRLARVPLPTIGMVAAHLGVAVAMIGMASNAAFTEEHLTVMAPGERTKVGPYTLAFKAIAPVAGPNYTAFIATMAGSKGEGLVPVRPELRFFASPQAVVSHAAIETDWNGQLYVVLGEQDAQSGRWQVRAWWKPFVTLIWLGGLLIALGGALALGGRAVEGWRRRARTRRAEEAPLANARAWR